MSCDLMTLAVPGVATLQPYQPGKPVEELERELGIKNIIKLASNENPLGASPAALQCLNNPGDISRYPDGYGFRLKSELAGKHSIDMNQIVLGNGSNEILELVTRAFVTPEHEVIFSEHAFAVYPLVTQAVGATSVVVPAVNYGHDLKGFTNALSNKTRLIFIANPNNPTGTWVTKLMLIEFLQSVPDNIIVVLDEAYFDYVQQSDYPDGSELIDRHKNLLVTRTFSKAYGLAGLRIGYGIGHPEMIDLLNRVRQPFNINSMALMMAEAALGDQEHLQKTVQLNTAGMQQLESACQEMGLSSIPSAGNFLCIKVNKPGREIFQKLLHEGVIVRPIDNYGMPDHIRVTIGLESENERFTKALKKVHKN